MTASFGEAVVGDLAVFALFTPLGLITLRVVERVLSTRFALSRVERVLLAFYSAGGLLYLFASVPVAWFELDSVVAILIAGAVGYGVLLVWERERAALQTLKLLGTPVGLGLVSLFIFLLLFELAPIWDRPFPNAWDGSVTALWTTLTVAHQTLPSNLEPFASAPVVYPLGTTVWVTFPVMLFGWSAPETVVLLPALFLALTVPAAYCWGLRWAGTGRNHAQKVGILFAAFFGLLASWPRFYTGGSYDFAFALPLLLLGLAILPEFVRHEPRRWRQVVGMGVFAGLLTSLSVAAGEALVGLLVGYILVVHRKDAGRLGRWLARVVVVAGAAATSVCRGVGALGSSNLSSYNFANAYGPLDSRLVQSALNPFLPWKFLISPLAPLSVLIQTLLAVGVALAVYQALSPKSPPARWIPQLMTSDLATGTATAFVLTVLLLLTALPGSVPESLRKVSNLTEMAVVLMLLYSALGLLPLVGALSYLAERRSAAPVRSPGDANVSGVPRRRTPRFRGSSPPSPLGVVVAALVLFAPLAMGALVSLTDGTSYIQQNVAKTSNVTPADVEAMEWVGLHLPGCSRILVAPGSAGQFLPEFATIQILLPMNPVPTNSSYLTAVSDLTSGQYTSQTRGALLDLSATEVFVTGQTSVSFPAIPAASLLASPDFALLYGLGDAAVFDFLPGANLTGCPA